MKDRSLDKSTGVSIGLGIVVIGAVGYLSQWMARVDSRLATLDEKVTSGMSDRWRGRDMQSWAIHLKELNPNLNVPAVVREKQP